MYNCWQSLLRIRILNSNTSDNTDFGILSFCIFIFFHVNKIVLLLEDFILLHCLRCIGIRVSDEYASRAISPYFATATLECAACGLLSLPTARPSHVMDADASLALLGGFRVQESMNAHE